MRRADVAEAVDAKPVARCAKKERAVKHGVTILDIRNDNCFKTGHGAIGANWAETKRLFEQAKRQEVPQHRATFLVDLHDPKGDLVDSVLIDGRSFRKLTGATAPTQAETRRYDREYWERARKAVAALETAAAFEESES